MKKSLANQIAKLWNEQFAGNYEPTKTEAIVCKNCIKGEYAVEVHPFGELNDGHAFFSMENITDIERAFKVSALITQDKEHKLYARIY